ncbi:MAG: VapC toxin family PIN domain ribonuclease [Rhodanobacteraceae bacterium]
MLAADTNLLVRIVTEDDPERSPKARKVLAENPIFVSKTVLLETEWVLRRGSYGLPKSEALRHLRNFARLPQVTVENPMQVAQAFAWAEQGMDFADALHLSAAQGEGCEAFVSFDRKFVAAARKAKAGRVKAL